MVHDGIRERRERTRVTKESALDCLENFLKLLVELVFAIDVGVAELVNVFGEVAE